MIKSDKIRELEKDYIFRDDLNNDPDLSCPIQLVKSGVIFRFGVIRILEETEENGDAKLQFEYHLVDNPNNATIDDEVIGMMGDIILSTIMEQIDKNESRTDNNKKSTGE